VRKSPIKKRNPERQKKEKARSYGSLARVNWVKRHPCCVPGCENQNVENAHIKSGGMGRKADYHWIVPLCFEHHRGGDDSIHELGSAELFDKVHDISLEYIAARLEREWQETM
jgi:hypothetical protein